MEAVNGLAVITQYKVAVRMSEREGAGTDEDLVVQIIGDQGVTRKETLERSSGAEGAEKFGEGTTSEFTVASIDVGKVPYRKASVQFNRLS